MTHIRGFQKISTRESCIEVDPETFDLLLENVPVGRIWDMSQADSSMASEHLGIHVDTIAVVASGVSVSSYDYGVFGPNQTLFALEWNRYPGQSEFPSGSSNDTKVNRYVFGVRESDEKIVGYDVTEKYSNARTGQIGDHHDEFEKLLFRYMIVK